MDICLVLLHPKRNIIIHKLLPVFPRLTPLGSFFSTPPFEGSYSRGGDIQEEEELFFNVIFSLWQIKYIFQTVAKLSILGQRMRPIVYTINSPGSYSREGVIFSMSVPRERGVNREGELFKEIRYLQWQSSALPSLFSPRRWNFSKFSILFFFTCVFPREKATGERRVLATQISRMEEELALARSRLSREEEWRSELERRQQRLSQEKAEAESRWLLDTDHPCYPVFLTGDSLTLHVPIFRVEFVRLVLELCQQIDDFGKDGNDLRFQSFAGTLNL